MFDHTESELRDCCAYMLHTHGLLRHFSFSPVRFAAFVDAVAAGYR